MCDLNATKRGTAAQRRTGEGPSQMGLIGSGRSAGFRFVPASIAACACHKRNREMQKGSAGKGERKREGEEKTGTREREERGAGRLREGERSRGPREGLRERRARWGNTVRRRDAG